MELNELAKALAKAQSQIKPAKADKNNPFFKSKYADLSSVWEAAREPLVSNGLAVTQLVQYVEGRMVLETQLLHESGQYVKSTYPIISSKQDSQAIGSALTYARRYALAAAVGVAVEDDDGESSMQREPLSKGAQFAAKIPKCPNCGKHAMQDKMKPDHIYCIAERKAFPKDLKK